MLAATDELRCAPVNRNAIALLELLEILAPRFDRALRGRTPVQQLFDVCAHLGERPRAGGLVLDQMRRNERVRRNLDRFGVATILEHILGKYGLQQPRIIQHGRLCTGPRDPAAALNLGLQKLGRGLQAIRLLVDDVAEPIRKFREPAPGALLPEIRFDLSPDLLEAFALRWLNSCQLDDMKAILRGDRPRNFPLFQLEQRRLELRHILHAAAPDESQVTAVCCRARILRVFLCELGELRRIRDQLLINLLCPRSRLVSRFGAGGTVDTDQNVACPPRLLGAVLRATGFIELLELGWIELNLRRQRLGRQYHVIDLDPLRNLELARIAVVILFDSLRADLHLTGKAVRRDTVVAHFAFLLGKPHQLVEYGLRHEAAAKISFALLLKHQILTQSGLENSRRHSLRLEDLLIALIRELVRLVPERRLLGDDGLKLPVTYGHAVANRAIEQQPALNQVIQSGKAKLRAVKQAAGDRLSLHHPAQGFLTVAQRVGKLPLRDFVIADPCNRLAGARQAKVGVHAEEGERDSNQKQERLQDAPVVANESEHGFSTKGRTGFAL